MISRDDARMLALGRVLSRRRWVIPEYPLADTVEDGTIGFGRPPWPRYAWDHDRFVIAGHEFSVRELLAAIERLEAMAERATVQQLDLFDDPTPPARAEVTTRFGRAAQGALAA